MKLLRSMLTAGLALAALGAPALAETLQPTADTYSTLTFNTAKPPVVTKTAIASASGASGTMFVGHAHHAFVQFNAGNLLVEKGLTSGEIVSAKLTIFFPTVTKAGDIRVHPVTTAWSEKFTGLPKPEPAFDPATIVGVISAASVVAKQFVSFDITSTVQGWLNATETDNGLAFDSPDGLVNATIGAKEGPGSGYPAVLEVEVTGSAVAIGAGAGSLGTPLDTALSAAGLTTGNGSPNGSLALELTNTNTGGNLTTPNVVGIGFGRGSLTTQAIVGGTYGADFLEFFVGAGATAPQMTINNDVSVANNLHVGAAADFTGKVGIGTNAPVTKLEVDGTITAKPNAGNFAFVHDNGTATLNLGLNGSNTGLLDNTNGPLEFETNGSIRMTVATNGRVGIGTTAPGVALEVNGGIKCLGAVDTSSDARYKMNIAPLAGALEKTLRLRGVSYDWNRAAFPDKGFDDRHQLGFIAQEVRQILPDVVSADAEGYLSIGYTSIIPVLTQAIQELKEQKDTEVAALKADNAALAEKLSALEARLTRLESALDGGAARAQPASLRLK